MTVESFFENFELFADVSNAVEKMRELVVKLAMQGKVVDQYANDVPGSKLLEEIIKAENLSLKRRKARRFDRAEDIEAPCLLPDNWTWTTLGTIADWGSGSTPSRGNPEFYGGQLTWLKSGELNDNRTLRGSEEQITDAALKSGSFRINQPGDVLFAMYGATVGKVAILSEEAVTNQAVCGCTPCFGVLNQFLFYYLIGERQRFRNASEGGAQPNFSKDKILTYPFPLPPLAEQKRIVAKVDDLMALCDRLEAQQKEREAKHAIVTRAAVARFSEVPTSANLGYLFHKSYAINPADLRKSILTLGVQGKLVPQDPCDEPADLLLRSIAGGLAARKRGVKEVKSMSDGPFKLPLGWSWSCFPSLGVFGRGKSRNRPRNDPKLFADGTYPLVQTGDVARSNGTIRTFTSRYNDIGLAQSKLWPAGTLCITIAANIADSGILGFEACIPDSVVGFVPAEQLPSVRYFEYFVRTAKDNLERFAPSTAQKNINLAILEDVLIPIPPAAEQRRIVAKVDALMELVDQLESQLTTSRAMACSLMEAVISELTGSTNDRKEPMKAPKTELVSVLKCGTTPSNSDSAPLAKLLSQSNGEIAAKSLWQRSGLQIDEFYHQLKTEIAAGWIAEPGPATVREL